MPGTSSDARNRLLERSNGLSAMISGAALVLVDTLLHPLILLPFFVAQLTSSFVTIALVPAVAAVGWLVPQAIAPWFLQATTRQLPWAVGAAVVRSAALFLLAWTQSRAGDDSDQRLRSLFIWWAIASVAGGFGSLPTLTVVERSVSGDAVRQVVLGRSLLGGILAVVGALAVRSALGDASLSVDRAFTLFFTCAALASAASAFFLGRIREGVAPDGSIDPLGTLRGVLIPFRDSSFQRFFVFGSLLAMSMMAAPFYVVFADGELGAPQSAIGGYLLAFTVAMLVSAPLWRWIVGVGGERLVLQVVALVQGALALVAFGLPYLIDSTLYADNVSDPDVQFMLYGLVFVLAGVAARGGVDGVFGYVESLSPVRSRSAYGLASGLLLIPVAVAPLIGAWTLDRYPFDRLFLSAGAAALVALLLSGILTDTNTRLRAGSESWRLRGVRT